MESCWVGINGHLRPPVVDQIYVRSPQYVFIHCAAVSELSYSCFSFTSYECLRSVSFTSSLRDWESIALLNSPYHSCPCRGTPLYWDNFHSGSASFLLLVKASVNALIKLAFSDAGAGGVGCVGQHQHNGIGAVCPYVGCITSATKGGAMLVFVLSGLTGMLHFAAWLLLGFCCAFNCKIGWLMAGLVVLGGRFGWTLSKTVAFFSHGLRLG